MTTNDVTIWMNNHRRPLLIAGPLAVFVVVLIFYLLSGRYVSSDDSYVQAANAAISANVPGQVIEIYAHDNQKVKTGERLFKLDDRAYKITVEQAQARLAAAKLQILALKATYEQQLANIQSAEDTFKYQKAEFERQKKLASSGISSQMQLNLATNNYNSARQNHLAAKQQLANILANLANNAHIAVSKHPNVQQAQAQLDKARLDLSYTIISAPMDGVLAKVEQLQLGDYINAGAPVFALISDKNVWIEANFKETEITHIQPGQNVKIVIDAFPNNPLKGYVASLSPGTGSTFSLLPPENASGNWVKIVQRLPLRIAIKDLDKAAFLKSGLSANVTVDIRHHDQASADKQ
jgi:membrane fusion protein, multidrug efflux system